VQTPGGSWTGFAWTATAGTAIRLAPRLALEVAYRYTDSAGWKRPRRPPTTASGFIHCRSAARALTSHGVSIGLRYAF
jgi:opacity protein-like surface antigen